MWRRKLDVVTALSLVLCVMTAGLWARSHFVHERIRHLPLAVWGTAFESAYYEAGQTRGVFWLRAGRTVQDRRDGDGEDAATRDHVVALRKRSLMDGRWARQPARDFIPSDRGTLARRLGFEAHAGSGNGRWRWWGFGVSCPHWAVALAAVVLPALRLTGLWRMRRRRTAGLCRACGYDLRATPGRCPECGKAVAA